MTTTLPIFSPEDYARERRLQEALRRATEEYGPLKPSQRKHIILNEYGSDYRGDTELAQLVRSDLAEEAKENACGVLSYVDGEQSDLDRTSELPPKKTPSQPHSRSAYVRTNADWKICDIGSLSPEFQKSRLALLHRYGSSLDELEREHVLEDAFTDARMESNGHRTQASFESYALQRLKWGLLRAVESKRKRREDAWEDDDLPVSRTTARGGYRESSVYLDLIQESAEEELVSLIEQRDTVSLNRTRIRSLLAVLARWNMRDREVITSFYLENESDESVATRLGYSNTAALRKQRSRLMKKLEAALDVTNTQNTACTYDRESTLNINERS